MTTTLARALNRFPELWITGAMLALVVLTAGPSARSPNQPAE